MALGQGAGESGAIQHTEQEKHTKELHRTVWNLPNHPVPTRGRDSFHRTSLLQALALNTSGMGQPRLHCSRMCICVFCHFQVLKSLCPGLEHFKNGAATAPLFSHVYLCFQSLPGAEITVPLLMVQVLSHPEGRVGFQHHHSLPP